jgi:hypothetical protein
MNTNIASQNANARYFLVNSKTKVAKVRLILLYKSK